ncbi:MAG: hypothetical protein K6C35_06385 [Eubacterium sp.]|nr:hypothetical protein [Eubacterium sp.]
MGLIIFIIIFYNLIAKSDPKLHDRMKKRMPLLIMLFIMLQCASWFGEGLTRGIGTLLGLGIVLSPFILIGWGIKKITNAGKRKNSQEYQEIKREMQQDIKLTESVPKRRKIVAKFNEKYSLCLTEEQIDRIVEASYSSYTWQREIYDMDKEYKFASMWVDEADEWLRMYLYVFPVMDISFDIRRQAQIVEDTLCAIFRDIDPKRCYSVDDVIQRINNKYLTRFDEKTFMIAYRFLQKEHHNYKLPGADRSMIKNVSEVDSLAQKYQNAQNAEPPKRYVSPAGAKVPENNIGDGITHEQLEEMIQSGNFTDDEIVEIIKKIYGGNDEDPDSGMTPMA